MSPLAVAVFALAASGGPCVLVLPPDPPAEMREDAWLGEVVSDLLPGALDSLGVCAVDRTDRLLALEGLEIPPVAVTRATFLRVAEALEATRVVVGRFERKGENLELALRIMDAERGTLSAPFLASGPMESLWSLVDDLAWDISLAGSAPPSRSRDEPGARRVPPSAEALRSYGLGLTATDRSSRVRALRRALQLAPALDEARLALARLQLEAREHAGAHETLLALREGPHSRTARFLQGLCLLELGRYRDAASVYAALASERVSVATLNNHALALLRLPSPPMRASDVLRKALELGPRDRDLAFNAAWALLCEGDPAAAAFWLKGHVESYPDDTHARVVLAWALRAAGRSAEAEDAWRAVLALAPSLESLERADTSRRFERLMPSERRLRLDEAARSYAELAASRLARAERYLAEGEPQLARRALEQAAGLNPHSARVHLLLGRLLREGPEGERAAAELRMSLWCRDDAGVRLELARLLRDLGREQEARSEAERVLRLLPENQEARAFLLPR